MWPARILRRGYSRNYATIREIIAKSPERIAVLHGSYSGNTQRYSKYLHSELKWRLNIDAQLHSIGSLDFSDLNMLDQQDTLLILLSTYGSGEPNEQTMPLWNELSRQPRLRCSFSVMSRGSSLYDSTFARAGIDVDQKFADLGATRLASLKIQDKMSLYTNDEYFAWKEGVISALVKRNQLVERPFRYQPSDLNTAEVPASSELATLVQPVLPDHSCQPQLSSIKVHKLPSSDRTYLMADISLPKGTQYNPGDYLLVWPENTDAEVNKFLTGIFGSDERRENLVQYRNQLTSYKALARHFLDIQGQPERELLLKLKFMAPSRSASKKIDLWLDGSQLVPSLATIFAETGSVEAPWIQTLPVPSTFIDLLPHQEPRRYSISSTALESPSVASLTAVVEHEPISDFWGATTGQFRRILQTSDSVGRVFASYEALPRFNLPKDTSIPLILFGIGTGVAPFRGFLRERIIQNSQNKNLKMGPVILFSGVRTPQDLVHYDEFVASDANPDFPFRLIPAYSRLTDGLAPRYIAESIIQNEGLIFEMIEKNGAHVYVCGDIRKVRRSVRNGIGQILSMRKGLPQKESKSQWKTLVRKGRVHLELW